MDYQSPTLDLHRLADRAALAAAGPIGVYVHFPFCRHHCWYCDFNVHISGPEGIARYLAALDSEIAWAGGYGDPEPAVETIYVGGGTPTHADPEQLAGFAASLRSAFVANPAARELEFTVEANPQDADEEKLAALAGGGVNRISFGVQSFNDQRLEKLDRAHSGEEARVSVERAVRAGIGSISVDLIYASPGQSLGQWRCDLRDAASLPVSHISCYALTLDSQRSQRKAAALGQIIDGDRQFDYYCAAVEILQEVGFCHYETSNWARPGHESRHNSAVWAGQRYLPLGCGAHGYIADRRYHLVRDPIRYQALLESFEPPVAGSEDISAHDRLLEAVTLPLRTRSGIDLDFLQENFGFDLLARRAALIDDLCAGGLVEIGGQRLRPTDRGMFLADGLGAALQPSPGEMTAD